MESIQNTCQSSTYRIYLIDNASPNPMPDFMSSFLMGKHEICYLKAEKNRGYAAGNNIGIAKALSDGCEVILIANNDIVFLDYAVERLAGCFANHPEIGIAGPKVLDHDGNIQISRCSMRTGIKEIFQLYTAAKKIFRRKWKVYYCLDRSPDLPSYVYSVSGCCFAVSSECAEKVLPFDEKTVLYGEEWIVGLRMEQAGYCTWYEPQSIVVHQHGATAKKMRSFMYQCISQSELYYCFVYLHAKCWQLYMLYAYRRILYILRCISDKKMRKDWKTFQKQQKQYLQTVLRECKDDYRAN